MVETKRAVIQTVATRIAIGFPENRKDWAKEPAVFDDHTLRIAGHPVMEDWEIGYMNRLASIASFNGGPVLELGYGMGLSARAVQTQGVSKHVIIECHPGVVAKGKEDLGSEISAGKVEIIEGFWEDVTQTLPSNSFSGILFDTYPLTEEEIHGNHFWFFKEAYRLLKPGGVFTYYSDEATELSQVHIERLASAGFSRDNIQFEVVAVDPPVGCEYWEEKTIVAPIVRK